MTRRAAILILASLTGCTGTLLELDPGTEDRDANIRLMLDAGAPRDDAGPPPPQTDGGGPGVDAGSTDAGPPPPVDAGPTDPCAGVSCGANAHCEPTLRACVCDVGFIDDGGSCVAPPAGDPATRAEADVCAAWNDGRVENASPPWIEGGSTCDPGAMAPGAIDDTMRRVNMFRWLAGMGPVSHDASDHQGMMECALMMSLNSLSHSPPTSYECYTSGGAAAAGRSNIAKGYFTPGAAIEGYMRDRNVMSLGHRRWILAPQLGSVEIGFAGRGQCLGVFNGGGSTDRPWTAYPNQGPAPLGTATDTWSFHGNSIGIQSDATVEVVRVSDGQALAVEHYYIGGGFGPPVTLGWTPSGWTPTAGERYRVTIRGTSAGDITYEVHLVGC